MVHSAVSASKWGPTKFVESPSQGAWPKTSGRKEGSWPASIHRPASIHPAVSIHRGYKLISGEKTQEVRFAPRRHQGLPSPNPVITKPGY